MRHTIETPTTPQEAVKLALFLAITAATLKQGEECVQMALQFSEGLTKAEMEVAKLQAQAMAAADKGRLLQ
jgi:hypothetical protein|tara:strand:+ start:909 stop:1121 length:213 start_codon:yes stop_codon:yes gene_type:complete